MTTPTQDRKQMTTSVLSAATTETVGNEIFDAECLKLINEYFYGVRLGTSSFNNRYYFYNIFLIL